MNDNMTRTLTKDLEDSTQLLVQDQRNNTTVEQSKEPVKDEILQEIRDFSFNGDDSSDPDEDSITMFDVFDYENGTGLIDVPVEMWPFSPLLFLGSKNNAVLLSTTGINTFIAIRPSNNEVYEIICDVLKDLNGDIHFIEANAELHRGLVEYNMCKLHKAGIRILMTPELLEKTKPMTQIDFDYDIKSEMTRTSGIKGQCIIDYMSPILRSSYGGLTFFGVDKDEDGQESQKMRSIITDLDKKFTMFLRSTDRLKFGNRYTLIIVPDEYRQITLSHYCDLKKFGDCKVVNADKALAQLATGIYERVYVFDIMDLNILELFENTDVTEAIKRMDITYGVAYGGSIPNALESKFFELQETLGPIRLVL